MKKTIELKLKLVEMLAKGAFGLNKDCMPLVREAYEFVTEDVDNINDLDLSDNVNGISEETAKKLSERFAEIANTLVGGKDVITNIKYAQPYLETALKDGVYLGYADHIEMFNGHNEKPDDVEFVAFKFGQVSLKVWHKDICDVKMTTDKDEAAMPYITKYSDAAHDFSGKARTEDLLARGLKCECEGFNRGWYIPSIGELYVMYLMKDAINEALEYTNRTPIQDTWYWSSTETYATYAWILYFNYGYFNTYSKTSEYSVRPVSAFNPLSF